MELKCSGCGGALEFSPKDKGNRCLNCGKIKPIDFKYTFDKNPIENAKIKYSNTNKKLVGLICQSCGAHLILNNYKLQKTCPYCNNSQLVSAEEIKEYNFETIVPFAFSREDALEQLKEHIKKKKFVKRKAYKNISKDEIEGLYINSFVFDFDTSTSYSGTLSYTTEERDREGNVKSVTHYKNVSGVIDIPYKNVTIEANSNVLQSDIFGILPYDYSKAVEFRDDFMAGYILEYPDKSITDAYTLAKSRVDSDVKVRVLNKHSCDRVVSLSLDTTYSNEKYNYTLLPLYILKPKDNKLKNVYINGQTGKISGLKLSATKILLLILFIIGGIALIALVITLLTR